MERYVECESRGLTLRGMLHVPDQRPGKVPFVILFHGFCDDRNEINFVHTELSRRLCERGIASVRFDFAGSGDSDGRFEDMTVSSEVEDGLAILDYVKSLDFVDQSRIAIHGLSMGGCVASMVAGLRDADVCALSLWCPAPDVVYNMKHKMLCGVDVSDIEEKGYADYEGLRVGLGFYQDALELDPYAVAAKFTKRVNLVHGDEDVTASIHCSERYKEAIATGVCSALRKDDMIESTHRGHGHCVAKGADVNRMMAEIFGKKTGLCQGRGGSMHIADFSVGMLGANGVVGGGYNLATGAALASKMILKNDRVSVVFFGDGASNRGTFHEAMNVASAWKLPVIFVNEMNCWASTTPYRTTCNVENISDRAAGYHVPGVIVDGQDVFAVYEAAKEAVARARAGEGPTFIEAKTYRIEGHFVGDPELYRDHAETQKIYHDTDPLKMFRAKAAKLKLMTAEECDAIDAKCEQKIKDAKEYAMQSEYADASEYMKYVYVDD